MDADDIAMLAMVRLRGSGKLNDKTMHRYSDNLLNSVGAIQP